MLKYGREWCLEMFAVGSHLGAGMLVIIWVAFYLRHPVLGSAWTWAWSVTWVRGKVVVVVDAIFV